MKIVYSIFFIIFLTSQVTLHAQWQKTNGPNGRGGYIYSVHTDGNKIYATSNGGTYFSEDEGRTWERFFRIDTLSLRPPGAFRSIGTSGNTIYAAYPQIYKSTDNGLTWSTIFEISINTIEKVSASGNWIVTITGSGLYQSTDGGSNWNLVDSARGRTLSMKDSICITEESISIDYGKTWRNFSGIPYAPVGGVSFNGSNLLIGKNNNIFRSTDLGSTWGTNNIVLNCSRITSLTQIDNYVFAGTDSGIFRSSDNGLNWISTRSGLPRIFVNSTSYIKNTNPVILAGTSAGIYRSSNMGETWEAIGVPVGDWKLVSSDSEILAGTSYDLGMGIPNLSYGFSRSEIYKSTDNGYSWQQEDTGLPETQSFEDAKINSHSLRSLYLNKNAGSGYKVLATIATTQGHGSVYALDEVNHNWNKIYPDTGSVFLPVIAGNGSDIFMGFWSGILKSTDAGTSWWESDSGTYTNFYGDRNEKIAAQVFSFDNDKIYAGGLIQMTLVGMNHQIITVLRNYVIVSTDGGNIWSKLELGDSLYFDGYRYDGMASVLTSIKVINEDLFIGTKALTNTNYGGGLYHYKFNGTGWVYNITILFNKDITSLISFRNTVFAASSEAGIYSSADLGTTWTNINEGLKDKMVYSLTISNDYLFAATPSGVYKRLLSEITSVDQNNPNEIPETFSLEQNYPNPFNPSTTIKYSIPEPGIVSLKVYNMLGEEVAILFDGFQQAGNYTVKFDAASLSSGVYLYRLKADNYLETKKLLLLK